MKRCPTCTRTFLDEGLSYCTDDGTPLVDQQQASSFDPQATVIDQDSSSTNAIGSPAPTRPFRSGDMPGSWPTPPAWSEPSTPSAPIAPPPPSWSTPSSPPAVWTPPPPPGGRFSVTKSQQNPVAIASLAVGVFSMTVGLCCYLGLGTGPIAIILGVIAMVQMKDGSAQPASKGMAIAGIATGAIAVVVILLLFILGIAFGSLR